MVSLVGIVAGIAAVLAVIVTSVVIAVCLAVGWMTDTARAGRSHSPRGVRGGHGGGRHAGHDAPLSGQRAQERFRRAGRLAYGQELASLAHHRLLHRAAPQRENSASRRKGYSPTPGMGNTSSQERRKDREVRSLLSDTFT